MGSSSSIFSWRPPSPFFRLCPGHWVVFLALSSACRLVAVRRVFMVPCSLVWCFSYLPCGPSLFRPLGCSTVSSLGSRRCVVTMSYNERGASKDLLIHPRRHLKKKKKKYQISVSITLSNSILNCSTLALFTASVGSLFHIGAILYVKKFPH